MENSFAITTTFIVYLILMLAIGVYAYQRTKNSADYFLGGRSLGAMACSTLCWRIRYEWLVTARSAGLRVCRRH